MPVHGDPVDDGALAFSRGRILAVGPWPEVRARFPSAGVEDLGEVALIPGLINSHAHLDYSRFAGLILPPRAFPDWIKSILALKSQVTLPEVAAAWEEGAGMLVSHGTTTVVDIEAYPELIPGQLAGTPLRVITSLELTGVRSQRPPLELLGEAVGRLEAVSGGKDLPALSPHAPYSAQPELLRLAGVVGRSRGWLISTHLAESIEEFEMFMYRRGPMFDWLAPFRDMEDCGKGSPIAHAAHCGLLGSNLLAVHVNHLWDNDARLLAESGSSVVHCPRSHQYFGHHRFPREPLAQAGVNLVLGTDSLASVRVPRDARDPDGSRPGRGQGIELDLFAEMRTLSAMDSMIAPEEILGMVTVNAARAIGRSGLAGQLREGAQADFVALGTMVGSENILEAVVLGDLPVHSTWIDGQQVWTSTGPGLKKSGGGGVLS